MITREQVLVAVYGGGDDAVAAVTEYLNQRGEMVDRITEVFAATRWIPVTERLPVEGEPVLACWFRRKDSMACAMIRNLNGKVCWTPSDQWAECDPPLAWMPLPEPPEATQ